MVTMDSAALRLSLHPVPPWNLAWIRSTAWKWPVLLLLSVELDDSESPRGAREAEPVDVIVKGVANEVVEAAPVATRWM